MKKPAILVMVGVIFAGACLGFSVKALAEKGVLGDESWYIKARSGNIFYITHGAVVWGHEFGFIKGKNNCSRDLLWLSLSATDERVRDFVGDDVVALLDIDGEIIRVELRMLFVGVVGYSQVMFFSDWVAGKLLIDALSNGEYVTVRIVEPKGLEALLDIKEDKFCLRDFVASRQEALDTCRFQLPDEEGCGLALLKKRR